MVIIYNTKIEAEALAFRLLCCKSHKDQNYTTPFKKYNAELYAVQVLGQHEKELTDAERSQLVELPTDWFPSDL